MIEKMSMYVYYSTKLFIVQLKVKNYQDRLINRDSNKN